jgi:hypothetical protein
VAPWPDRCSGRRLFLLPLLLCQRRDRGPEVPSGAMLAAVLIRLGQGRVLPLD